MHRYAQVSGSVFGLVAVLQLLRVIQGWPVTVNDYAVPMWASVCATVVAFALASWGFRSAGKGSAA